MTSVLLLSQVSQSQRVLITLRRERYGPPWEMGGERWGSATQATQARALRTGLHRGGRRVNLAQVGRPHCLPLTTFLSFKTIPCRCFLSPSDISQSLHLNSTYTGQHTFPSFSTLMYWTCKPIKIKWIASRLSFFFLMLKRQSRRVEPICTKWSI